jgi:hypothetical protein
LGREGAGVHLNPIAPLGCIRGVGGFLGILFALSPPCAVLLLGIVGALREGGVLGRYRGQAELGLFWGGFSRVEESAL